MNLSRGFYTFIIVCIFSISSYTQTEGTGRKGDILVESGSSLFAFENTSGTGGGLLSINGFSFGNLYLDIGKFITDEFAIKLKGAILYSSNQVAVRNLSIGGKYYIAHKIPLEITAGMVNPFENNIFIGNAKLGYAIPLAPNINLEPSIGLLYIDSSTGTNFSLSFAMFL